MTNGLAAQRDRVCLPVQVNLKNLLIFNFLNNVHMQLKDVDQHSVGVFLYNLCTTNKGRVEDLCVF